MATGDDVHRRERHLRGLTAMHERGLARHALLHANVGGADATPRRHAVATATTEGDSGYAELGKHATKFKALALLPDISGVEHSIQTELEALQTALESARPDTREGSEFQSYVRDLRTAKLSICEARESVRWLHQSIVGIAGRVVDYVASHSPGRALGRIFDARVSEKLILAAARVGAILSSWPRSSVDFFSNISPIRVAANLVRWPESKALATSCMPLLLCILHPASPSRAEFLNDAGAMMTVAASATKHADDAGMAKQAIRLMINLTEGEGMREAPSAVRSAFCLAFARCMYSVRHNCSLAHDAFMGVINIGRMTGARTELLATSGTSFWWCRCWVDADPGSLFAPDSHHMRARDHAQSTVARALRDGGKSFLEAGLAAGLSIPQCMLLCSKAGDCPVESAAESAAEVAVAMQPLLQACYSLLSESVGVPETGFEEFAARVRPEDVLKAGSAKERAVAMALPSSMGLKHLLDRGLRSCTATRSGGAGEPAAAAAAEADVESIVRELARSAYNCESLHGFHGSLRCRMSACAAASQPSSHFNVDLLSSSVVELAIAATGRNRLAKDPALVRLVCSTAEALSSNSAVVHCCMEALWCMTFSDVGRSTLAAEPKLPALLDMVSLRAWSGVARC